jgi:hypothetical protein
MVLPPPHTVKTFTPTATIISTQTTNPEEARMQNNQFLKENYDPDRYSDATIGASVDTLLPEGEGFPDVKGTPDGGSSRRSISGILKSIYKK